MAGKFKTKDVANKTGIPANMVRKYSQTLEQFGYLIDKAGNSRTYTMEDMRLLKVIHERVSDLNEDINDVITFVLQQPEIPSVPQTTIAPQKQHSFPSPAVQEDVSVTIQKQNKKFEEFMGKLDTLAQLNEAIIHQNSTLITQNRQKDEKLDELMQQVYIKESKQEELLHDIASGMQKTELKQEEKLNNVLSQVYKKEVKQEEKMNKLINHVYKRESSRDEQLMSLIREMQETKRMIAASQESTLLKSLKNVFVRFKSEKADSR